MEAAILLIVLLSCSIFLLLGGLGIFILKPSRKDVTPTPTITIEGITVQAENNLSTTTEYYTYADLSKNIKINITWSNGGDFEDVTNVYFTRTHGTNTEKKETDASGRTSNTTGNKIEFVQKTDEDMRGKHSIKVTYKLRGQTAEKDMTTFEVDVTDDQITLAADTLN